MGAYEYKVPTGIFNPNSLVSNELKITGSELSTISFHLKKAAKISLNIYDINGKCVMQCVNNQVFPAGNNYHIAYLGSLAKGDYIVKLSSGGEYESVKFIKAQ